MTTKSSVAASAATSTRGRVRSPEADRAARFMKIRSGLFDVCARAYCAERPRVIEEEDLSL